MSRQIGFNKIVARNKRLKIFLLNDWGWVMHICVSKCNGYCCPGNTTNQCISSNDIDPFRSEYPSRSTNNLYWYINLSVRRDHKCVSHRPISTTWVARRRWRLVDPISGTCRIVQYIPRKMHMVFSLLCFVVVIHWLIFPYPSGLLHWHCGNLTIAPVPAKQPWWIWINTSCEFIMNDCITTTKQSTTKPCAYFLGYTVI